MNSPQAERFLYQLAHNLKFNSDVQPVRDASDEAKETLQREGFEQVVRDFNHTRHLVGYDEFSVGDFEGAVLFPDSEYAETYQRKHIVHPVGMGVIVPVTQWQSIARKIKTKSDGQAFDDIQFSDSPIHLDKLGFIIHSENGDLHINKEHELMHVDNDVYSANHTLLRRFEQGLKFEGTYVQDRIENEVKRELIAYRNELVGKADEMGSFLANGRLGFYVNWLASNLQHPDAAQAVAHLLSPLREKVKPATDAMEYLTGEVPSQLLTPLLFSIGSTAAEVKDGKMISVLDDIVRLADSYSRRDLRIEQLYDGIKQKGYDL
jgi:hypothetical protein